MANCPKNHGLQRFKTPRSTFRCDICKNKVGKNTEMYGCRSCDYDLCRKCMLLKQGGKPICPGGHGLEPFTASSDSFSCDRCRGRMSKGFGCRICNYDLCRSCMMSEHGGKADCPAAHGLQQFNVATSTYACDKCKSRIPKHSKGYGCRICNYDLCENCWNVNKYDDEKQNEGSSTVSAEQVQYTSNKAFDNLGALGELLQIITSHMDFMNQHEQQVDTFINKQSQSDLLRTAKEHALKTEKELMEQIMNISEMNNFLNNIIKIENLFNTLYSDKQRAQQQTARNKYASNILLYEQKQRPVSDVNSFVDLMFAGTSLHIRTFKKWLVKLENECKKQNVKIICNSGAKCKNIERAFYKAFYVYAVSHRNEGFKQMTDVLRCSLVFDNFEDLYGCYNIIEQLATQDNNAGILRCKDRFNPIKMPFGYRDMLINVYCPGSKIVCEIQLHHQLFYQHKKISHKMYKKARLFQDGYHNMAYQYANEHIRKIVGNEVYVFELKEDDMNSNEEMNCNGQKHEYEIISTMTYRQLFESWNLSKLIQPFIDEGYGEENEKIDVSVLNDMEHNDLVDLGLKKGHIKKYNIKLAELKAKKQEFEVIEKQKTNNFVSSLATEIAKESPEFNALYETEGGNETK